MNKSRAYFSIIAVFLVHIAVFANTNPDIEELANIEVIEQSEHRNVTVQLLPENAQSIIDTAEVLKKMAGANVNRNGPLTGIAQYRGLFGNRVNVKVDGVKMLEAGPNSMDAVMSYMPASMVSAVVLKRGIAPVSTGIETIGGSIVVVPKSVRGSSESFEFGGEASLGFTSVNSGLKASTFLSAQSAVHNLYFGASSEQGDSYDFNGGSNYNTEYDRDFYLFRYSYTGEKQTFALKLDYNNTGKSGTPSLPMDIVYVKGGVVSVDYSYQFNQDWQLTTKFAHQDSVHLMQNYLFRNPTNRRYSYTQVNSNSFGFTLATNTSLGNLTLGIEGDDAEHQAEISDPDNAMFHISNFDIDKNRISFFAELQTDINEVFNVTSGIRYTQVDMFANDVSTTVAMMDNPMGDMHRMFRDQFNAADRNLTDNNVDFAFNLTQKLSNNLLIEYGLGYKTRSPSYQERYLWLPLEATAGLADGFKYVGNLNLKPENALQLELGMTYDNNRLRVSPHIFYHQVDDYIQGTATQNSQVLKFNNVDAKLYGADIELSYEISNHLAVRNVTSYVRGQRRDIDDNLYRIAPLNTRIELMYSKQNWSFASELVAYQAQNNVSETNAEQATPGYGIINIAGTYNFTDTINLAFGVDNLLDKQYYHHLNGYNRNNLNVDVGFDPTNPRASRLPGEGTNIYTTLYISW